MKLEYEYLIHFVAYITLPGLILGFNDADSIGYGIYLCVVWMAVWDWSCWTMTFDFAIKRLRGSPPNENFICLLVVLPLILNVFIITFEFCKFGYVSTVLLALTLIMMIVDVVCSFGFYYKWARANYDHLIKRDGPFDVIREFSLDRNGIEGFEFFEFFARGTQRQGDIKPDLIECRQLIELSVMRQDHHVYDLIPLENLNITRIVSRVDLPDSMVVYVEQYLDIYEISGGLHLVYVDTKKGETVRLLFKSGQHFDNFVKLYPELEGMT